MKYSEVIKNHLPINKKRTGKTLNFKWITVHNTGNPKSSAANEREWLTNPENTTSTGWHIVVDGKEAIEAIPIGEIAYHAGTYEGNTTSIGIEICDSAGLAADPARSSRSDARPPVRIPCSWPGWFRASLRSATLVA